MTQRVEDNLKYFATITTILTAYSAAIWFMIGVALRPIEIQINNLNNNMKELIVWKVDTVDKVYSLEKRIAVWEDRLEIKGDR